MPVLRGKTRRKNLFKIKYSSREFPLGNKWSKTLENRVKSRVRGVFSVEKTVENVKDSPLFSPFFGVGQGCFPLFSSLAGENHCGKVDETVENP